ncbi:glutamine amidotransferase [Rhodovibrionaceae bacterium A322]
MCGIVGLFAKTPEVEANLGKLLSPMLEEMTERGPDSAGVAFYRNPAPQGGTKLTLTPEESGDYDWAALAAEGTLRLNGEMTVEERATHAVLRSDHDYKTVRNWLKDNHPDLRIVSGGDAIEIFKETGRPKDVIDRFGLVGLNGTHALGHTRMATESAVTTDGSHPFSTGEDLCLVHNGSLSNHFRLRDQLRREGIEIRTENDSEVAAGYLTWRMEQGDSLDEALESALKHLDGFFTFAVGTRDGFAVVRDPISCKHAVMAETDDWVAMATEFRAIATLPGAENAKIWEPEPAKIYSWSHN